MQLLPELFTLGFSLFFLFLSLGRKKQSAFVAARLLALILLVVTLFGMEARGQLFSGAYQVDLFSQIFKFLLAAGLCLVVFMLENNDDIKGDYLPEYFMLLGFSTLGLMMLVSAVELITIAVSLEISSFSLYAVVPLRKSHDKTHLEAAVKYLFFGAIATGIMIYGMGYLYGMSHTTYLAGIITRLPEFLTQKIGILALALTLAAFFFKLSLFPLHFWAPDVYEGASNTTTAFIATVPKIAATAVLLRLLLPLSGVASGLPLFLILLAAFSMTLGNLVGLVQKDIKRLLAFSGIAHAGYLMMGILPFSKDGGAAAIYYMLVYLIMTLACFYVVILISRQGKNVSLGTLAGLAKRSPLLAFTLAAAAFSLAGIPPTGGFTGKLFLFVSAFKAGYLNIVLIGAVNTVLSMFYYLNLVRMAYSREAEEPGEIPLAFHQKALCYVFIFLIFYLGLCPFGILDFFRQAV
ncbi:MAG: NADH-quinone oxidoreductase subunit N [Syntrophales bacterium]